MPSDLFGYDAAFREKGFRRIAGIDEVGRGPLAGPVVAAAVVLPEEAQVEGLRDSKTLNEKQLLSVFGIIVTTALDIGLGFSDAGVIDKTNILAATKIAMGSAVADLSGAPDLLLIDAVALPSLPYPQECPIKGDSTSASIAAASVVAKVVRDDIMRRYHGLYPQYGFDRHKGYGTKEHIASIRRHGPCPIHRMSFRPLSEPVLPL